MTDTMMPPESPMGATPGMEMPPEAPPSMPAGAPPSMPEGVPETPSPTDGAVPQDATSGASMEELSPPGEGPKAPAEKESLPGIPTLPTEKETGKAAGIRKIADDYVIPLSDSAAEAWAKISKDNKHAEFTDYAKQIAIGLYPTLAPQIELGLTTRVLVDPYIQLAEKTLGPLPEEPDWGDPKWAAALQGGVDPKTGRSIPMTLSEWQNHVQSDPRHGFDASPKAMSRITDFINEMHKSFTGNRPSGGEV